MTRVLVVEGDADLRWTLVDILEAQGYAVDPVEEVAEAMDYLTRERPALAIVDLVPPHLLHRTAMRHLCARLEAAGLPVIAITSVTADKLGVCAPTLVLRKPFGLDALVGAVRALAVATGAPAAPAF